MKRAPTLPRTAHTFGRPMAPAEKTIRRSSTNELLTFVKATIILAASLLVIAVCTSGQAIAAKPPATPSPFAGTYYGYLDSRNYGSMSISDSGNVSGYFGYSSHNYYESYTLSGRVTAAGVMRLKVVHSITVRDRPGGTWTERYFVTINVALDESGNLVATSGASFVLSPGQ